jgi:hypothetical protein
VLKLRNMSLKPQNHQDFLRIAGKVSRSRLFVRESQAIYCLTACFSIPNHLFYHYNQGFYA